MANSFSWSNARAASADASLDAPLGDASDRLDRVVGRNRAAARLSIQGEGGGRQNKRRRAEKNQFFHDVPQGIGLTR